MDPATIALTFRRVLLSGILGLALLIPASVIPWPGSAATCAAASTHRVAVVIQHGDGSTLSRCVGFTGASIKATTTLDALHESGIDWRGSAYQGLGMAVCQVDGEPATFDATNCLKPAQKYWVLFVAHDGGGWTGSNLGISSIDLRDGDALGLRYELIGIVPTILGNCPAPTPPTAKPTPKPTARPTTRPTATPGRTSTPGTPAPGATDEPSTPATPPEASPTDGGIAAATFLPTPGATFDPDTSTPSADPSAGGVEPSAASPGGDAPLGLILVAIAGLAFAALGVIQVRRQP